MDTCAATCSATAVKARATGWSGALSTMGMPMSPPLRTGSALIGQTLRDAPIRRDFGVILVAVIGQDGAPHFTPGPDFVLREGAVLVSVGPPDGLRKRAVAEAGLGPGALCISGHRARGARDR